MLSDMWAGGREGKDEKMLRGERKGGKMSDMWGDEGICIYCVRVLSPVMAMFIKKLIKK